MGAVPFNDAGLLEVAASLRASADAIASIVADHSANNEQATQCLDAMAGVSHNFMALGMILLTNGWNIQVACERAQGITWDDEDDTTT